MVAVSPLATPSSMIAALTVGRYSEASVLINWSTATTASSHRYGRTYCRSSARSIPLLSHTGLSVRDRHVSPENCINRQVNRHVGG